MTEELLTQIELGFAAATGNSRSIASVHPVSGGCINETNILKTTDGQRYFVKSHSSAPTDMFAAESAGLSAIADTNTIAVPQVIAEGKGSSGEGFLILETIECGKRSRDFFETFGHQLANLHRAGSSEQFGFSTDNFLGSTAQPNPWTDNWTEFWAESRLGFQLRLATRNGQGGQKLQTLGKKLIDRLEALIGIPDEPPGLIHGDLWSGNFMVGSEGQPVLIDPAVYYGSREAEFGMTTLFGGFPSEFYDAYLETWPLADGWETRVEIYRLYHLLNHLNLFGSSYLGGCLEILEKYK